MLARHSPKGDGGRNAAKQQQYPQMTQMSADNGLSEKGRKEICVHLRNLRMIFCLGL